MQPLLLRRVADTSGVNHFEEVLFFFITNESNIILMIHIICFNSKNRLQNN